MILESKLKIETKTVEELRKRYRGLLKKYHPDNGKPFFTAFHIYSTENFLKIFLVLIAMISDTIPENKTTAYSNPLQISNRIPYNALPNGCAHIETVRMTAITFPIRFCGVSV